MRLKNKVAVVTGAANGIGKGIALKFAEEGANIVANDISFLAAENLCETIEETWGKNRAIPVEADVSKADEVERLFRESITKFAKIDILISNAGVKSDAKIHAMSELQWDQVVETQLKGGFNCVKQAQKYMVEQRYGKIVILAAPVPSLLRRTAQVNFETANAGLAGLTKSLAIELGKYNINVNCIAPEFILTDMTRENAKKEGMFLDDFKKVVLSQIPLRRLGTTGDVANVALFLVSDDAGYVSGQVINVRGGP